MESYWCFVGIKTPEQLMKERNIHFFHGNTVVCMEELNNTILKGTVKRATFNMPDPCFKRSHKKRRMINETFLEQLSKLLDKVLWQSIFMSIILFFFLIGCRYLI